MEGKKTTIHLKPAEKYCLTVAEASAYFGIGQKKIRQIAEEHKGEGLLTYNGVKLMIHRTAFEKFLNITSDI